MKMKKIRPESKLFPKFIPETSLGGSPENFRITLTAKPGVNEKYNLNLSNNCPAILDQLKYHMVMSGCTTKPHQLRYRLVNIDHRM
jgi:hypothetical protein